VKSFLLSNSINKKIAYLTLTIESNLFASSDTVEEKIEEVERSLSKNANPFWRNSVFERLYYLLMATSALLGFLVTITALAIPKNYLSMYVAIGFGIATFILFAATYFVFRGLPVYWKSEKWAKSDKASRQNIKVSFSDDYFNIDYMAAFIISTFLSLNVASIILYESLLFIH